MSHVSPTDELIALTYELLDAHDDTARLAADPAADLRWAAHLDYLRDLQRVARGVVARAAVDSDQDSVRSA
jgi:hypothetical protein